jgi:hypothetical protein
VQSEQTEGKGPGKEGRFRDKAPVYGPFVEEGPAEFESASKVAGCAFPEGIAP